MSESWNAESDLGPGTTFLKVRFTSVSPIPLEDGSGALELPALLRSGRESFWVKSLLAESCEIAMDGGRIFGLSTGAVVLGFRSR